jgi:hypothetical protein
MGHSSAAAAEAYRKELEMCKDFAQMARINCKFAIKDHGIPDGESEAQIVSSFARAYDEVRGSDGKSLCVVFDWNYGNQSGHDWISYSLPNASVTDTYVERHLGNLVIQRIAQALYRGFRWEDEFDGEVTVVDEYPA